MSADPVYRWRLPLTITLKSPFVTRGLNPENTIVDVSLPKNRNGDVTIHDSLIEGTVRDALEAMAGRAVGTDGTACSLCKDLAALFGSESGKQTPREASDIEDWRVKNEPERGDLTIGDLTAVTPPTHPDGRLTRVQIDDVLGAVREGHLQEIELPWPIGAEVTFEGWAELRPGRIAPEGARRMLETALALVPAFGAVKSAGFGECVDASVGEPQPVLLRRTTVQALTTHVAFALTLDRAFLVAAERAADNIYRGSEIIPGGVIKGALAKALQAAGAMDAAMDEFLAGLVVGHAFPISATNLKEPAKRRRVLPLSWVMVGKKPVDILLATDFATNGQKLKFQVDWKETDRETAQGGFPWEKSWREYDIRTHTAIDPDTGAARWDEEAGSGMLFSTNAVCPHGFRWDDQRKEWVGDTFCWVGRLALRAPDDGRLGLVMGILEGGLPGIGKTGAIATASWLNEPTPEPEPVSARQGMAPFYALTLQTPALLNDLGALRSKVPIVRDYTRYWQNLGYRLVRFFARQRLAGGHIALRYPVCRDRYDVYFLTEPGSVFLITPDPACAEPRQLDELLQFGLPPDGSITYRHWKACPFLPENGFGMVACNVVEHGELKADLAPTEAKQC